jgi:hypothetical protein
MKVKHIKITGDEENNPTLWNISSPITKESNLSGRTIINKEGFLSIIIDDNVPVTGMYPNNGKIMLITYYDENLYDKERFRVLPPEAIVRFVHEANYYNTSIFKSELRILNKSNLLKEYQSSRTAPESINEWDVGVWYRKKRLLNDKEFYVKITEKISDEAFWVEVKTKLNSTSAEIKDYWTPNLSKISLPGEFIRTSDDFNISIEKL